MKKYFPVRLEESDIIRMKVIANVNKRSSNKQIEHILHDYIKDYERINGKIIIEDFEKPKDI